MIQEYPLQSKTLNPITNPEDDPDSQHIETC